MIEKNKNGILIGICGARDSGKDTLADYLVENHSFTKYALADPMKRGLKEFFGFTDEQLWTREKEKVDERYNISPRHLLQWFGTEIFQYELYNRFPQLEKKVPKRLFFIYLFRNWYHKEINYVKCIDPTYKLNIVVSDIRFPHEAAMIKLLDGHIIKIFRNKTHDPNASHASETELNNIKEDFMIYNDNTKKELYECMNKLIK